MKTVSFTTVEGMLVIINLKCIASVEVREDDIYISTLGSSHIIPRTNIKDFESFKAKLLRAIGEYA